MSTFDLLSSAVWFPKGKIRLEHGCCSPGSDICASAGTARSPRQHFASFDLHCALSEFAFPFLSPSALAPKRALRCSSRLSGSIHHCWNVVKAFLFRVLLCPHLPLLLRLSLFFRAAILLSPPACTSLLRK